MSVDRLPFGLVCAPRRTPVDIDPLAEYVKAGVRSFGKGLFSYEPAMGADLGKLRFFALEPNRLVISNIKAWEGAVALSSPNEVGRVVSNRFLTYASETASLSYLREWLLSAEGNKALQAASPGSADRNRTLAATRLELVSVPLPPRPEQDRIANHLESLAHANRDMGEPSRAFQAIESGVLTPLSELIRPVTRTERVRGDATYAMSGVRWYGQGLFVRERKTGDELAATTVRRIEPGDLVYNRLFAWKQSFALAEAPGWASNEFPTFRIDEDRVRPRVLLAALLGDTFTDAVNQASTGSTPTSRNRLKERDFLALSVRIPPSTQQAAAERALRIADRAVALEQRRNALAAALAPAARNEIFDAMR